MTCKHGDASHELRLRVLVWWVNGRREGEAVGRVVDRGLPAEYSWGTRPRESSALVATFGTLGVCCSVSPPSLLDGAFGGRGF